MAAISKLDNDDPDVHMKSLPDKYAARPDTMEYYCLVEFAPAYMTGSGKAGNNDDMHDIGNETEKENEPAAQVLYLKIDIGTISKRSVSIIVRSHQWSLNKNPENVFHAQLLLYCPWKIEMSDLLQNS